MVANNHNEIIQEREELAVFDKFAEAVGLKVRSRRKCDPPAPDVMAELEDDLTVACELLELCDESLKWKDGAHYRNARLIQKAIDEHGALQLKDMYIDIRIREYTSKSEIASATPEIVEILNSLPVGFKGEIPETLLNNLRPTVLSIQLREMGFSSSIVHLGPVTSWTDKLTARATPPPKGWSELADAYRENIEGKISKPYETDSPIELIAWCGDWGWSHASVCWLPQVETALFSRSDIGQFRRI